MADSSYNTHVLLAVLRKVPDDQYKKLSNLLTTKIRPSYAKLFKRTQLIKTALN